MVLLDVMEETIAVLTAKEEVKSVMEEVTSRLSIKEEETEIVRELRDLPPAHYLFKIENFSQLANANVENYQSSGFEVGGYKWRLSLCPKGNKKVAEEKYISLYLILCSSNALALHKEVNVCFSLFLYNQIQDKYLAVQDGKERIRRFRGTKREWGFDQFVSLDAFYDASNGYLVDDCCIFGAEILVIERSDKCKGECVSIVKEIANSSYTWNVENFPMKNSELYNSQVFVVGGHKWVLSLYPNGFSTEKGKSLSLYLHLQDSGSLSCAQLYTEFILRARDKLFGKHHEQRVGRNFCPSTPTWGFPDLISLSDLNDISKGYMVDDQVILEVEIPLMTVVKDFS